MPRKCINLESQPGFQEIYAPNMQRAIDEGLSGYSGTGVVDWGYDQDKVVKPPPRIKDERTKPRRKLKDFSRTINESRQANRVRRLLFEAEETGNPKGIFSENIIGGLSDKGLDFLARFLEANPLNSIEWHGNKSKSSAFNRKSQGSGNPYKTTIIMKRGRKKRISRVARHETGHFIDYILGLMISPADSRNPNYFFSDLSPSFGTAFQNEFDRLGLGDKKTRKEFLDSVVEDFIAPVEKLEKMGLASGLENVLSDAAGVMDIVDALTGGAWALRGYGGGHGTKYYSLKDQLNHGNSRLHETFANLFEAWSSKDRKSWQRMKKYFPELTKEFDKMMDVYADPTTTFNKVTGIGSSGPRTTAPNELTNPSMNRPKLPESFKRKYGLSDVSYVNASELPERGTGMNKIMRDSIAEEGVLLPILLVKDWEGGPQVVDGVNRVEIAKTILDQTGEDIKVPVIYTKANKFGWDDIPKIQEFIRKLWYNNRELPNKETNEKRDRKNT